MLEPLFGDTDISEFNYSKIQSFFNNREKEGIETNRNIKKALSAYFFMQSKQNTLRTIQSNMLKLQGPIIKENLKMIYLYCHKTILI